MHFFKKKKSDIKLPNNEIQQQQQQQRSVELTHPNPPKKPLPLIDQAPRQNTPPSIIMPKPRRLLTPTRAILGRYSHDKTLVVEEEEEQLPSIISPILLPMLHQEQVVPKKRSPKNVLADSTSSSNESSQVYESAQEYVSDEEDNTRFSNLSSFSPVKKEGLDSNIASDSSSRTATPGTRLPRVAVRSIVSSSANATPTHRMSIPAHITLADVPTTTAADVDNATAAVFAEYNISTIVSDNNNAHHGVMMNNHSTHNNNPVNTDSNISLHSGTAYNNVNYADNNNRFAPVHNNSYDKEPLAPNETKYSRENRHRVKEVDELHLTLQKQKEEQDALLHMLTKQVAMMEKQRILDREEWCRKEQELLAYRQVMTNTLDETQQKLANVLKSREEQKEKEAYYQQQLQQQQLQQLQESQNAADAAAAAAAANQPQEEPEYVVNDSDDYDESSRKCEFYNKEPDYNKRRELRNSKSEEYMRFQGSRSSSRASVHHTQRSPLYAEEERRPFSRRNSNASNRSNKSYRLDPSPSVTMVDNPATPRGRRMSRPRARSIEAEKWHSSVPDVYEPLQLLEPLQSRRNYSVERRRSTGRSRSVGRPQSMAYYGEADEQFDDYDKYYEDPRYNETPPYYRNEYYRSQPAVPPHFYYDHFSTRAPPRQQPRHQEYQEHQHQDYQEQQRQRRAGYAPGGYDCDYY